MCVCLSARAHFNYIHGREGARFIIAFDVVLYFSLATARVMFARLYIYILREEFARESFAFVRACVFVRVYYSGAITFRRFT